ncbi:MAG: ABC transporter substrate-binding protein [Candidatus Methylomirabilales bacterium]
MKRPPGLWSFLTLFAAGLLLLPPAQAAKSPIRIGLAATFSGGLAVSGQAIERGLTIAVDEINARGGLLGGRRLEIVKRDDGGKPANGVAVVRDLAGEGVVAIFGGLFTPVTLAQLGTVHDLKIPYMDPWAAGTPITRNGRNPNYMFRVSANDDYADKFLVDYAIKQLGRKRPGLALENTAWGQSNQKGLTKWLDKAGLKAVGIEKFNWGDTDMSPQLGRLRRADADILIMVANAPEGAQVVKSKAKIGWGVPILSHWGISGGKFAELTGKLSEGVTFLQTYTFFGPQNERGKYVLKALKAKYGIQGPEDITAPVGTANAYDAMHLLAMAIEQAGSTKGPAIQQALENLRGQYRGLIKVYRRPFTPEEHDALSAEDFVMCVWKGGKILPVSMVRQ